MRLCHLSPQHLLAAAWFLAVPLPSQADPYSVDLQRFSYGYGATVHTLDFSIAGNFPPGTIDPATGLALSWGSFSAPGFSGVVGGVYRMSVPQAVTPPRPSGALSLISGSGSITGAPPLNWSVTASFANASNATTPGTFYLAGLGGGNASPAAPGADLAVHWFTGEEAPGVFRDHVLGIVGHVRVGAYSWRGGDVVLTDLNPQDTAVELRVDITGDGRRYDGYYRIDGSAAWTLAYTHTLPDGVGVIPGFYGTFPLFSVSNEVAEVPEPATAAMLSAGLLLLTGLARRPARAPRTGS